MTLLSFSISASSFKFTFALISVFILLSVTATEGSRSSSLLPRISVSVCPLVSPFAAFRMSSRTVLSATCTLSCSSIQHSVQYRFQFRPAMFHYRSEPMKRFPRRRNRWRQSSHISTFRLSNIFSLTGLLVFVQLSKLDSSSLSNIISYPLQQIYNIFKTRLISSNNI